MCVSSASAYSCCCGGSLTFSQFLILLYLDGPNGFDNLSVFVDIKCHAYLPALLPIKIPLISVYQFWNSGNQTVYKQK